jgi:two-component system chemotaxis sensor kinase CheA
MAVLLVVLTIVDGAVTLILLGAGCEEINPAMDYLLRRGPLYFLLGKYALTTACLPFLLTFRRFPLFRTRLRVGHLLPIFVGLYIVLIGYQIALMTQPPEWSRPSAKTKQNPCPIVGWCRVNHRAESHGDQRAIMREAFDEFLAESYENLDRLDRDLVAIEANPGDRSALDGIFRTIHTLKGTSGFFTLPKLGALAHAGESLLARLRDGSIAWQAEITSALLALNDALRLDLRWIESSGGTEPDDDHADLIAILERLQKGHGEAPQGETVRQSGPSALPQTTVARAMIRVDVDLLDRLMDVVSELVLARNQLLRFAGSRKDSELSKVSQRVNLITSALQEGVMKARMRPIGTIWDQFPRVVRDLAGTCGKQVRLELAGGATELDRTVIEAIKDPLTHLVRNAVDHGIERPEARRALGKPEVGRLSLTASHEGGMVLVQITDDGGGIDPSKVARKALEVGLVTPEQAGRMSEDEVIRLIFQAGFSTAEAVSSVSGRGVGLDVVRANIEAIGGTIEVRSRPGQGTTLAIKIPLTLAIIPTLIVFDGQGDRYAIPQPSLVELIRLEGSEIARKVEKLGDSAFHRLRGELIPLVELDRVVEGVELDPLGRPVLNIVMIQVDGRRFGLLVEEIGDTEEIVVKPLGRPLGTIPLFAGATILGDGRVALILDVHGIARAAGLAAVSPSSSREPPSLTPAPGERRAFLMLGLEGGRRLAVPLADVSRLEEVPASAVSRTAGLDMILHRGRLLPLVRLGLAADDDPVRVVVCDGNDGRSVGLVVRSILDVVEAEPRVERSGETFGLVGPALFVDQVADLVDVPALIGSFAQGA